MNVSAIGCTSLKPNQSSFKARRDADYSPRHRHNPGEAIKKVLVAASVFTAGTIATQGISAKLLAKLNNDGKFAQKIGKKAVEAGTFVEEKLGLLNTEKKLQGLVKKYADEVMTYAKKFAAKGVDEAATSETKAINGIKRSLTYLAGGSAGIAAAKDSNHDGDTNIKDLAAKVAMNVIDAAD